MLNMDVRSTQVPVVYSDMRSTQVPVVDTDMRSTQVPGVDTDNNDNVDMTSSITECKQ
jgi:hypothetical protein